MTTDVYKVPDLLAGYVAWTMDDGNVMAGKVIDAFYGSTTVKRMDGSVATINSHRLRAATCEDVLSACKFFGNIGKGENT